MFEDMLYTEQLDRALSWYKNHGTAEQQAWMGLYLGRSYVKDKLFIPATKAYSDALSLTKEKHLYNVAGYICSYMADLYQYTGQRSEERRKVEDAVGFSNRLVMNEVMPLPCEMWQRHGHLTIPCRWRFTIC